MPLSSHLDGRPDDTFTIPFSETRKSRMTSSVQRLLVSVRSKRESDEALHGGADILDVKEPSLGSLGMAGIDAISAISSSAEMSTTRTPLSVALGEVTDWPLGSEFPVLPHGIDFVKLGLSQCRDDDWQAGWLRVRAQFQQRSKSRIRWVAVAYADSREAASPVTAEILTAAIETDCAGLLIDTWTKDGRTLFDETDAKSLKEIANRCHESGLFFALAGRLNRSSLALLAEIPADVIAIRSAACNGSDRTLELDADRVREFRKELHRRFQNNQ